jgi:hypothetical protein
MSKVRAVDNERLKMVASAFSNVGVAALALGFLPLYQTIPRDTTPWRLSVLGSGAP